ncbi:hypothetical protein A3E06_01675 [Candidatus Giovannonibacteria bacterium RIFCSPHIGHO2_12_FULL_44_42]|nr:MAG: hypothetical protein A3E06_01675 [Candidatus Giovannonibacteria bacterium RIFCSPHIGHO2_12_FULL_44_42]OGF88635.1 MAG: hypothetical protein A3I94_03955 [Candidatus Giovannonibacteria bacterium RIFCSPLOWO2_02_FULL_43_54]OGF97551.1 MAG: hypothetical protein A3H08_00405 [Candidatus Giovannonibacteria bacterium RIFCSPLOWO2_12_FULL_44_32]
MEPYFNFGGRNFFNPFPDGFSKIMLIKDHGRIFDLKVPKTIKFVYVCGKGLSLFANKRFKEGDKIIYLKGKLIDINKVNPSPETIQISDNKFLDSRDYVPEDFISHSCVPNAKFDLVKRQVIAIKNISKNEEITFNYLTTEWDMKKWGTDFKCICGSKNCFGHINGFKYLSRAEKLKLKPLLSPLLLKKIS